MQAKYSSEYFEKLTSNIISALYKHFKIIAPFEWFIYNRAVKIFKAGFLSLALKLHNTVIRNYPRQSTLCFRYQDDIYLKFWLLIFDREDSQKLLYYRTSKKYIVI
jgi:hypothetical protein